MTVVVSIKSVNAAPVRLVGHVTKAKDGSVAIAYKEPGQIKETNRSFLESEVVAALAGEAGFVVAMLNVPVTQVVGELTIKDGVRHIKTENGTVILNNISGVAYDVKEVDADSKEARQAERAGKVKVRASAATRAARKTETAGKGGKTSRAERIAAKKAAAKGGAEKAPKKSAKVAEEAPAKKKTKKRA